MRNTLITTLLFGAFLTISTLYYLKHRNEQAGPVIYSQSRAAEEYDIDSWIEEQVKEQKVYEIWKQEQ